MYRNDALAGGGAAAPFVLVYCIKESNRFKKNGLKLDFDTTRELTTHDSAERGGLHVGRRFLGTFVPG